MLARKYRITKDKEYKDIFQNGVAIFSEFFTVKCVKNGLHFHRFGFIVSLKVSKKAYVRAKIKRWLRESARKFLIEGAENGFDTAIIAKKGAFEAGFEKINKEMEAAFRRAIKLYESKKNYNNNYKSLSKDNIA